MKVRMLPKHHESRQAAELRKKGLSLSEIADKLRVSKSSASLWVRNVKLSPSAATRIALKRSAARERSSATRQVQTKKALADARHFAEQVLGQTAMSASAKMILCSMIYWCEGTKSKNDGECSFTNSDPRLVSAFLRLFRSSFSLQENRFRVCMHLHVYHNEQKQAGFWSAVTGIPKSQFIQTYKKANGGSNFRKDYPGCIQVRYYDVRISRQLQAVAREYMQSLSS